MIRTREDIKIPTPKRVQDHQKPELQVSKRTPIKEWGVVKFLSKKLPDKAGDIISEVANVALGQKTIFQAIGSVLSDNNELTSEDIARVYELAQIDHDQYLADLGDRKSARDMQVSALRSDDKFVRRFVYYYAGAITFSAVLAIVLLFFVEIPEGNQRIIDMALGILIGVGLTSVFQFLFGSSTGSKTKDDDISSVLSKIR